MADLTMTTGLIAAMLSSLSLAIMAISDRLMINDFYGGDTRVAWFVSSVSTFVLGSVLTLIIVSITGTNIFSFKELVDYDQYALTAGIFASLTMFLFFKCFGEGGESAVIASWFVASPLYVLLVLFSLQEIGFRIENVKLTFPAMFSVLVSTIGLFLLEWVSYENKSVARKYYYLLTLMIVTNTAYVVIIDQTITHATIHTALSSNDITLGLLPWFLSGFLIGVLPVFSLNNRLAIIKCWKKILQHWQLIISLEIIGMFVFYFEFIGLGFLDPTLTTIIVGAHLILVLLFENILSKWGKYLLAKGEYSAKLFGVTVSTNSLVCIPTTPLSKIIRSFGVLAVLVGIVTFFLY